MFFPNVYEIDRLAQDLPKAYLAQAELERLTQQARHPEVTKLTHDECSDRMAEAKRSSVLSSRLLHFLKS